MIIYSDGIWILKLLRKQLMDSAFKNKTENYIKPIPFEFQQNQVIMDV